MKNAVQQFIEKLENLVNEFKGMKEFKVKKKAEIGNEFELLGITWKIIDITEKGCLCLAEKLENKMQYDSTCNDWRVSDLRKYLNTEFYKKLSEEVGVENIAPFVIFFLYLRYSSIVSKDTLSSHVSYSV